MPGVPQFRITHDFDTSVAQLQEVGDRASDLTPSWINDVQPLVTDFLTQRFDSEGAFGGAKWADLSPVTVEMRKRPGHGRGGIGRDTGAMWASWVKSAGSSPAPGGVLVIEKDRYERGSSLPQSLYFDQGTNSTMVPIQTRNGWLFRRRKSPKHIPARPIIPDVLPPSLIEQVELSLAAYITGSGDR